MRVPSPPRVLHDLLADKSELSPHLLLCSTSLRKLSYSAFYQSCEYMHAFTVSCWIINSLRAEWVWR